MFKETKETAVIPKEMPEYKLIDKIQISKSLLKSIIKFSQNSTSAGVEGFLFGHEGENEITIENAFPTALTGNEDTHNVV